MVEVVAELNGVSKHFRQRQVPDRWQEALRSLVRPQIRVVDALSSVDLRICRGESVAYAGPNGAGKSTTIKLLCGMLAPDSGTVRTLGSDPARHRTRTVGRLGVVFGQRTELWWDQPVSASFEWKRVVWDIPTDRYERMQRTVRDLLDLDPYFHSVSRTLSLGQRMRADLGLALLHEPEILLLDEPTLGLDVLARRAVLQFIQRLNREQGVTVMVTSHDMAELEQLAGRIVLVDRGRIAFDGDFDTLRREHAGRRRLTIETASEEPPALRIAEWVGSEGRRHEFLFDADHVSITTLLAEASAQTEILDVETHRADIDDVIADIYAGWAAE